VMFACDESMYIMAQPQYSVGSITFMSTCVAVVAAEFKLPVR
jgi:hypothetical protein